MTELEKRGFIGLAFFWVLLLLLHCTFSSGDQIGRFYLWRDTFVVTSLADICEQPLDNRCVHHYFARRPNGSSADSEPFGYQFDGGLDVGARFSKDRVGFRYQLNGATMQWSDLGEQTKWFLVGLVGLSAWFLLRGPRKLMYFLKELVTPRK